MANIEKMKARLEKAYRRLEGAEHPKEIRDARMSVRMRERNLARMLRNCGEPDLDLERRVERQRQTKSQKIAEWKSKKKAAKASELAGKKKTRRDFYFSDTWRSLRYQAFLTYGRKCLCCGATPETGAVLHVDHIKPRSTHPELSMDLDNLQILCADCNLGKSNVDDTDFRPRKQELVWDDGLEQMKRDLETACLKLEMLDDQDAVSEEKANVQRLRTKLDKAIREREYPH
ncbi:MAG: HNH endonuclease [Marinobacter sp.]|nr:HNH endonuclease [Marinobacter sp.]